MNAPSSKTSPNPEIVAPAFCSNRPHRLFASISNTFHFRLLLLLLLLLTLKSTLITAHRLAAFHVPTANMAAKYSPERLKQLRDLCETRLPPASAVQAMFLYELEREKENEKLFHDQMFRLARTEDASNLTAERISQLERKLNICADRHSEERTVSQAGRKSSALEPFVVGC